MVLLVKKLRKVYEHPLIRRVAGNAKPRDFTDSAALDGQEREVIQFFRRLPLLLCFSSNPRKVDSHLQGGIHYERQAAVHDWSLISMWMGLSKKQRKACLLMRRRRQTAIRMRNQSRIDKQSRLIAEPAFYIIL